MTTGFRLVTCCRGIDYSLLLPVACCTDRPKGFLKKEDNNYQQALDLFYKAAQQVRRRRADRYLPVIRQ
jgi:hypothetical protein